MTGARAVAAAAVLLLAACAPAKRETPPVPPDATAGGITAAPCTVRDGKAEFRAVCGVVYVPENRARPSSRLIALPYQRILAEGKAPGEPVFLLNGGPGLSNMFAGGLAGWFVAERDVVLMGYRGVDGSVRLDCPEVDRQIRRPAPFLDRDGLVRVGEAFRQCAARLQAAGTDLKGYTVLATVDDIDTLRRALGYRQIDLLGMSYGTRVAMVYGWRYPGAVRRSALVSVNPPGHFRFDPVRFEAQLGRYGELCAADAACASRSRSLTGDIRGALARMPKRWLGFPVNRDAATLASFTALYSTGSAGKVFDTWIAAAHSDYSGMALISAIYPLTIPHSMVWGDFAAKGGSLDFEPAPGENPLDDIAPGRTLMGAPLNVLGWAAIPVWPVERAPEAYRRMQPSAVETLMVSGSLDVATPAENARDEVLPAFPNARQVELKEFGHVGDLLYAEPGAARHLLATFFATGTVDASRFAARPVSFDPGWLSLPAIAKGLLAGAAIALALAVLLVRWIVVLLRRAARRRQSAAFTGSRGPV